MTTYPVQYGLCEVFTDGGIKGAYITTGWIDPEGYIRAPQKPGLGYEIDWDVIEDNILFKI